MKKFTLFLITSLFSALSFAALNPYAYGLKSDLSLDESTLTVNYSLNADATGVNIVILNGETVVKTIACDGKTKGSYTVEVPTTDFPKSTSLTWKVEVLGNSVATPTKQTEEFKFYLPHSLDVDVDTESDYFGRWYVIEATNGGQSKSGYQSNPLGRGLYAFDAALNPILNSAGTRGFTGGMTLGAVAPTNNDGEYFNLYRVATSGGRVFVGRFRSGYAPVLEATDLHSNDYPIVMASAQGRTVGLDVRGRGENLQLALLGTDFTLKEYNLGTAASSASPAQTRDYSSVIVRDNATITYDNEGGMWINQNDPNGEKPTILHLSAEGVDYDNVTAGLPHTMGVKMSGIAVNPNGTELAVVSPSKIIVYTISKDSEGKISLTTKYSLSTSRDNTALSYDYAGNLYAGNRYSERINFYAMPYDGKVTTPAPSKYAFELTEVVPEVYTVTVNKVGEGTIEGGGEYLENFTVTLKATPAEHYEFTGWTGDVESNDNPLVITSVNSDLTVTANFKEHAKYTITAQAADNSKGYVTGGGKYYVGETVTLKAVANSTYYFVNWSDGNTDATRTFTATADVTLTANFAKASPRAWAYDLKMVEDGDNYKFSFNATTAANATLLFLDKEGNELYTAHDVGAVAAGANTISIEKAYFTQVKDVYWSVKMDGEAITSVAEITDQTRGIYDFYNMQGVVVDNDPNSEKFGEIYIEMAKSGTTNSKAQTLGLFLLNQNLDVLNTDPNVGIQPTMPSGYVLNGTNYTFQRLNIHPKTGDLVFSYGISSKPAVFAIDRKNMTSSVTNLLDGITGLTKTVAHCFDTKGTLFVMDLPSSGTIYKIVDGQAVKFAETTSKFVSSNITMESDGRGGLWVAQNRGQIDSYYQLVHYNNGGTADFYVYDDKGTYNATNGTVGVSSTGLTGYSTRGALAYDAERQILAQGRNNAVEVFSVAYDATTGVPSLTKIATTPIATAANIDGIAFDYAGDLYVVNSGNEKFNKYTLPTAENICTVPAPESQAIIKEVRYTVTVNTVGNGTATGAGEYVVGETATLIATPAANHRFVNWTKGEEVASTETTYSFVVTEDVTLTANFEAIPQYAITVETSNAEQGSVTGGGTYYEGTEVTIRATAVGGFVFEKWSDDNTANPRTITVSEAATYTAIFKLAPARVFAYNLDVVDNGDDTYTLSFIPNTNAVSGRVILYNGDTKAQIHEESIAGAIVKGVKSEVVISRSSLPATGNVTWAVELTGEQVEKLTLLTKADDKANYGFNRPQGVAIDNNPASDFFGRIYIALPKAGGTGYSDTNYGIVVMDPLHNRLKSGVVANSDALGADGRYSMHRVAVNPTNGHVYYVRTSDSNEGVTGTAIYELTPDATNILTDGGIAKNVISGASDITNANSVCFDETGAMYVMANANYDSGASLGRVYKVVDGVVTLFTPNSIELASRDNAIVPDGKGGFWAAQHRDNFDTFSHLFHITATGTVDYSIDKNSADASLLPVQPYTSGGKDYTNASYRGQVAYYSIDENNGLVAYGGGAKVSVFKVSYDGAGKPSLTAWQTISLLTQSTKAGVNVDGIAFDYAGNIIVMSATDERMYQYALPIESVNTSLVPSPTSKTIKLGTLYNVEVAVNDNAMGTATGDGEYLEGEPATVTATANTGYRFLNWTNAGVEVSTNKTYSFTVTESVTLTANFAPLPEITYELNGGVWNQYGWTSKKDMYNALLDDWRAYSGSTRTNVTYEAQLGIGKSKDGIPTTITSTEDRVALQELFADATYAPKWGWLATYVDAVATTQYKKMDAAQGVKTQPTSGAGVLTYTIGNFFGEDKEWATGYIDAVDFTGVEAHLSAFAPYWGQTFPMPTQPTEEIVLNAPYKEGYLFDGWYAEEDFSGTPVTIVDQNTDGTLYAKWIESVIIVTIDDGPNNTAALTPHDGETVTVKVNRSFGENKILTLTLPFDISATQISTYFGNATVYEFYNVVDAGEELHLQFYRTTSIEAGKPYILQTTSGYDAVDGFTIEDVTITTALSPVEIDGITMVPVLDGDGELNQSTEYYLSNNALYCAGTYPQSLLGLRAYFTSPSPTPIRARVVFGENEATSIPMVTTPETKAQKIIQDGRLIIIRGEHQYNAQGQIIE